AGREPYALIGQRRSGWAAQPCSKTPCRRSSQPAPRDAATRRTANNHASMAQRYVAPGWFSRNVVNRVVAALTRLGISVWGSRVLEVRGRRTGEPRRTPVNLLTLEGSRYLVAARGQTQWVRNLRVAGE